MVWRSDICFLFVSVGANFLAWVYGKGHAFLKIWIPIPPHTLVLKNMTLFSVQFCKGNNLSWDPCVDLFIASKMEKIESSIFTISRSFTKTILQNIKMSFEYADHTAPMRGYYPYEIERRKGSYFPILGYVVVRK